MNFYFVFTVLLLIVVNSFLAFQKLELLEEWMNKNIKKILAD